MVKRIAANPTAIDTTPEPNWIVMYNDSEGLHFSGSLSRANLH